MNSPLIRGTELLNKKSKHQPGSKAWKILLSKAATLAMNAEFHEYRVSRGARGLSPELQFHIIFSGVGSGTKCTVEVWLGTYDIARQTAGAVSRFDIADILSGATQNELAGFTF